jgi:uncharacterized protein (DUF1800 family)
MAPRRLPPLDSDFSRPEAERLLWRAGFGPGRGDANALAALGLHGAVQSLLDPPAYAAVGPEPHDSKGNPLAPRDAFGHDHLWWLDRMVRGNQPLVERMTLIWHDWFATSQFTVNSQSLMLNQNQLFRKSWAGSFRELLLNVTQDPAMLVWLNGNQNRAGKPNENYAREMMELFTLGAYQGYGEQDVREQARALSGFRNDNDPNLGLVNFRYDPAYHDDGSKTIFGQTGNFSWQDACELALQNPAHPTFFVRKLWSYFIPLSELDARTQRGLEQAYVSGGFTVAPVLEAILVHPALYKGPRMVKPPVVYTAGLLRALGRGIDSSDWIGLDEAAGQRLFYPPNVSGWDDDRWLDTQTFHGRWALVADALEPYALDPAKAPRRRSNTPAAVVDRALAFWDYPDVSRETYLALRGFAQLALADAGADPVKKASYPTLVENALRQLIAVSPDYLTC